MMRAIRIFLVSSGICMVTLATAQDLLQTAEESDLSQVLKASGTLLVRETHSLPNVATIGSSAPIECDVVIVRVRAPLTTLSKEDSTTVGLQLAQVYQAERRPFGIWRDLL